MALGDPNFNIIRLHSVCIEWCLVIDESTRFLSHQAQQGTHSCRYIVGAKQTVNMPIGALARFTTVAHYATALAQKHCAHFFETVTTGL